MKWTRLKWHETPAILAGVVVIVATALPRLPPGICQADGGDLQFASTTLGIAHPPGYAGYVTIGFLLTRLPGVDPAYLVSLACLTSGTVAVCLLMLVQVRAGLNAWVAAACGVMLAAHPRVWQNLIMPEVYAPSLALVAGGSYLLLRYAGNGRQRDFLLAALLYGFLVAGRPPMVVFLPFLLPVCRIARRRRNTAPTGSLKTVATGTACLLLPSLYALGYLWLRDTPTAPCNYIEQYNAENEILPPSTAGFAAKWQRVLWHARTAQYHGLIGSDWAEVRAKLQWLRLEVGPDHWQIQVVLAAMAAVGLAVAIRRTPEIGWVLAGLTTGTVAFLILVRLRGLAADIMPLLFAFALAVGLSLLPIFPREPARWPRRAAVALATLACAWCILDAPDRTKKAGSVDATHFLTALDLPTFPAEAVICSEWTTSPPLWYARHVLTNRSDLTIVNAKSSNWHRMIQPFSARPVFFVGRSDDAAQGRQLIPFRTIWRLMPSEGK